MKSAGKARNNGLYRHIRTSKEIIRNLLNDYFKNSNCFREIIAMAYEWGKYINGEVFIEDPIIINNGNIISTEELENKENFNIKQIKYEDFPGIEEGYWFSNYWEETPKYIIQKWKKEKIQTEPSRELKVIRNQFEYAYFEILEMIDLLEDENKRILSKHLEKHKLLEPVYEACADLWGVGNVFKKFVGNKYTLKQLFEEIDLHRYLEENGMKFVEDGDFYCDASGTPIVNYCYFKSNFFKIDSIINFKTTRNTTYLKMSYIYLYTLLDEYLLKLIGFISRIDMRTMIKYIPNISIKDVIEAQNRNDLVGKIVEQLIYKMGWNSMQDKIEFFENCGIGFDDTLVDNLILIGEKRNIIVHNQGVVNCDFIKKLSKTHHKDTYKVNDTIETTVDMLKADASVMKKYVEEIYNAICNKYSLLPFC